MSVPPKMERFEQVYHSMVCQDMDREHVILSAKKPVAKPFWKCGIYHVLAETLKSVSARQSNGILR